MPSKPVTDAVTPEMIAAARDVVNGTYGPFAPVSEIDGRAFRELYEAMRELAPDSNVKLREALTVELMDYFNHPGSDIQFYMTKELADYFFFEALDRLATLT